MVALILDLETENHTHLGRKASPFCDKNYVIAAGWQKVNEPIDGSYSLERKPVQLPIDDTVDVLVGHNIKYDLLFLWDNVDVKSAIKRGCKIWDTQYAEYLLEGMHQGVHMLSMDEVAPTYGGTKKIDEVKLLWEKGYLTSQIDKNLLMDYLLNGDIPNTRLMYDNQLRRAKEQNMLKMIELRMEGLLATTEMEYNGLYIDKAVAFKNMTLLNTEIAESLKVLNSYMPKLPPELEFNWGSNQHKSCLFFGGSISYQKRGVVLDDDNAIVYLGQSSKEYTDDSFEILPVLNTDGSIKRYKGGKRAGEAYTTRTLRKEAMIPKTRLYDFTFKFDGIVPPKKEWQTESTDADNNPLYSLCSDNIEALCAEHMNIPLFKAYNRYSVLVKDLRTYYITCNNKGNLTGMLTKVGDDSKIHHSLNHTSTVTGRLSCTNPNLQTIPKGNDDADGNKKSRVKEMFVSRFGADGVMIEIDYSQLEVVIQGVLTKDKQLCEDLRNRVDFHCKRLAIQRGEDYDEVKYKAKTEGNPDYVEYSNLRTLIKGFSFQRAYGAGAAAIALSTGMSIDAVKELIELENITYSGVNKYYEEITTTIQDNAKPVFSSALGLTVLKGQYQAPTGTTYTFMQQHAPDFLKKKDIFFSFSPTQIKNYPVQGFGGEVVQTKLGELFRLFNSTNNFDNKALLVNTVHDCVWIDCANIELAKEVTKLAINIMESIPDTYNRIFNMNIDVPFPVEAEAGKSMATLHHL